MNQNNDDSENSIPKTIHYTREKLGMAVWKLATGIGEIKERLGDAFIELAILKEHDFPVEFREEFIIIRRELTIGKMIYESRNVDGKMVQVPIGFLCSTLRHMRKLRAKRIAISICELQAKIEHYIVSNKQD